VVVKLDWDIECATGTHREYNSSFTTELALNALWRSHSLIYLRLLTFGTVTTPQNTGETELVRYTPTISVSPVVMLGRT
jgi:hypothetical protein